MEPEWQGPIRPDPNPPEVAPGPEAPQTDEARVEYQVDDFVGTPIEDLSSGRIKIEVLPSIARAEDGPIQISLTPRSELPRATRRNLKREAHLYGLALSLQLLSIYVLLVGLAGVVLSRARRGWRFGAEDGVQIAVFLLIAAALFELGRRLRNLSEGARWLTLFLNVGQAFLAIGLALGLRGPIVAIALAVVCLSGLNIWALVGDTEAAMFSHPYRALVDESDLPVSPLRSAVYWANALFFTAIAGVVLMDLLIPYSM